MNVTIQPLGAIMKTSILVLTALSTVAGIASAQSTVEIYGIIDAGVVFERGGPTGSVNVLTSGVGAGSRLGFRGKEDLGGGMSANFVLEHGPNIDVGAAAQGGLMWGRQSWVGLEGGFGAVKLGRQYTPYWTALLFLDPFFGGYAGVAANVMASSGVRMNNTVKYTTPTMSGFTADIAYGLGEVAGSGSASRAIGLGGLYANGPLTVRFAHHNLNNALATDSAKNTMLGGIYDFGVAKVHAAYAVNKGTGTVDSADQMIGVVIPVGGHKVIASLIRKDDKSIADADANQAAIGYVYSLSKRTSLYTSYAHISNKNGAAFRVGSGNGAPGSGTSALNFGMTHSF
jgi:predicted porin